MKCKKCKEMIDPYMVRESRSNNMSGGDWCMFVLLFLLIGWFSLIYLFWSVDVYYCPDCKVKV